MDKRKLRCPVICETLNKRFFSIKDAAKFAKVNNWTMSVKMETAGQFIDKEGNVYKRLKPMITKNAYKNTGAEILVDRPHYTKTKVEAEKSPVSGIELAKSILKNKAFEYVNANNFKVAKELLDVIEQIKE